MPELVRLTNCKVCIYPGDHLPPHFHVRGRGWVVSVDIVSLKAIAGSGPRGDIEEAIRWARVPDNLYRLTSEWRRLNDRD